MKTFAVLFTFVLSVAGVAATVETTQAETVRVEQAFVLPVPGADADAAGMDLENKRKKKKRDRRGGEEDEEEVRLARCSQAKAASVREL